MNEIELIAKSALDKYRDSIPRKAFIEAMQNASEILNKTINKKDAAFSHLLKTRKIRDEMSNKMMEALHTVIDDIAVAVGLNPYAAIYMPEKEKDEFGRPLHPINMKIYELQKRLQNAEAENKILRSMIAGS